QVIWTPHTDLHLSLASPYCIRNYHIWRSRVPLACFAYVEWHYLDCVARKFGLDQHTQEPFDTDHSLHAYDKRGRHNTIWTDTHQQHITLWDQLHLHAVMDHVPVDEYMEWYRLITYLWIAPPHHLMLQTLLRRFVLVTVSTLG
ncbi:PMD domain-containing protein, partial [Cephalotus follicularis]